MPGPGQPARYPRASPSTPTRDGDVADRGAERRESRPRPGGDERRPARRDRGMAEQQPRGRAIGPEHTLLSILPDFTHPHQHPPCSVRHLACTRRALAPSASSPDTRPGHAPIPTRAHTPTIFIHQTRERGEGKGGGGGRRTDSSNSGRYGRAETRSFC